MCLNTVLNVKALVDTCTQEMALVGAFFVIVKSSRTFVCSSSVDGDGWCKSSITLIIVTNNPAPAPGSPAYWPERRVCRGVSPRYLAYIVLYILYIIVYGAGRHVSDVWHYITLANKASRSRICILMLSHTLIRIYHLFRHYYLFQTDFTMCCLHLNLSCLIATLSEYCTIHSKPCKTSLSVGLDSACLPSLSPPGPGLMGWPGPITHSYTGRGKAGTGDKLSLDSSCLCTHRKCRLWRHNIHSCVQDNDE